jgi:hypothetical protein
MKVYTINYNQESLVEMFDGIVVKVVNGPVSEQYLFINQPNMEGNYLVYWIISSCCSAKGGWHYS